jgi:uncharacterized Fe-S radical SAM superfamily protein PflX
VKVKMTRKEHLATEFAKRYAKGWDYFAIATEAYLDAYEQAKRDILENISQEGLEDCSSFLSQVIEITGQEQVEQEIVDGMHQLSVTTFNKWKEERNK